MERIEVKKKDFFQRHRHGKGFLVKEQDLTPEQGKIGSELVQEETDRYEKAVEEVIGDLEPLASKSDIFAGHLSWPGILRSGTEC